MAFWRTDFCCTAVFEKTEIANRHWIGPRLNPQLRTQNNVIRTILRNKENEKQYVNDVFVHMEIHNESYN